MENCLNFIQDNLGANQAKGAGVSVYPTPPEKLKCRDVKLKIRPLQAGVPTGIDQPETQNPQAGFYWVVDAETGSCRLVPKQAVVLAVTKMSPRPVKLWIPDPLA